jgi:hypothetical protein
MTQMVLFLEHPSLLEVPSQSDSARIAAIITSDVRLIIFSCCGMRLSPTQPGAVDFYFAFVS